MISTIDDPSPIGGLNRLLDSEDLATRMERIFGSEPNPESAELVGRATELIFQYSDLAPDWKDASYFVPLDLITDASDDAITKRAIERLRTAGVLEADPKSAGQGVDLAYRVNVAAFDRYAGRGSNQA